MNQRFASIARYLLGLGFVVFASNYFVPFLPAPASPPARAMPFLAAFAGSGFLTFIKTIELASGLALLANRFVPLALALLAPIIVGITLFHALLAPAGLGIAILFVLLELALAWSYRAAFAPMLRVRTDLSPLPQGATTRHGATAARMSA